MNIEQQYKLEELMRRCQSDFSDVAISFGLQIHSLNIENILIVLSMLDGHKDYHTYYEAKNIITRKEWLDLCRYVSVLNKRFLALKSELNSFHIMTKILYEKLYPENKEKLDSLES